MAIGDTLTLIKTETVPYYIAFGAMQHLTQVNARIMSQFPSQIWSEKGVNTKLEIEIISPQHNPLTRFPAGNFGINSLSGNGATFHTSGNNLIIDREGSVETHTDTMELDYGTSDTFRGLVGITCRTNVIMSFYICNGVYYVKLDYGPANNKGTAWQYKYNMYNQNWSPQVRYKEAFSSLNLHCAPNDDRMLYIDGVNSYTCAAIALEGVYRELSFKFQSTCKLFMDSASIDEYNSTGDESGSIENLIPEEEPAEDRKTELYYKSTIYKRVDGVQEDVKVGESNITFVVQYKSNDGTENYPAIGQVAGYVNDFSPVNTSTWGNIKWKKSSNAKIVQIKVDYTGEDGVRHSQTYQPLNFPYNTKNYGFYESYQNGSIRYYSKYATNMRIYANESDIDSYLGGDPTVKPLYDGNTGKISPTDYIGDPVVYNEIDYTVDADMSSCWILTKEEVDELAEVFAIGLTKEEGDDDTLINITKTCARSFMAQSEPIDAVVDLFWLPIDVTGFCTSEDDNMTFSYDRYGILNGAKTIIDGIGETMTVVESNTLRIGDSIGKFFVPINNLSTSIGATIGSAGSTSEVINTYNNTTSSPSVD